MFTMFEMSPNKAGKIQYCLFCDPTIFEAFRSRNPDDFFRLNFSIYGEPFVEGILKFYSNRISTKRFLATSYPMILEHAERRSDPHHIMERANGCTSF